MSLNGYPTVIGTSSDNIYFPLGFNQNLQGAGGSDIKLINPPESSRTYSSIHANNAIGTGHARSMLDSAQAWSSGSNSVDSWMQIDLCIDLYSYQHISLYK